MDLKLDGKVALVMGAGGGLGGAIARALAAEGAKVAIALADLGAVEGHVGAIEGRVGPVDILVNNTGGPPPTPAAGQPSDVWEANFRMMVTSVIAVTDRVLPGMRERRWGRIITSTSSGVVAPIPNLGISNALRLSLVSWSKTLAREVARDGVTANVILPGRIATGRIRFLDEAKAKREGRSVDEISAESTASIPVGRYGDLKEYADVIAFLASPRASYVTGTVQRVDGGLLADIRPVDIGAASDAGRVVADRKGHHPARSFPWRSTTPSSRRCAASPPRP